MVAIRRLGLILSTSSRCIASNWPSAPRRKKPTPDRSAPLVPERAFAQLRDHRGMGGALCIRQALRQWCGARLRSPGLRCATGAILRLIRAQAEIGLTAAGQFKINLGQDLGIEQSAVQGAVRIIDAEPAAKRVQRGG